LKEGAPVVEPRTAMSMVLRVVETRILYSASCSLHVK
jgi:hypothetical protein